MTPALHPGAGPTRRWYAVLWLRCCVQAGVCVTVGGGAVGVPRLQDHGVQRLLGSHALPRHAIVHALQVLHPRLPAVRRVCSCVVVPDVPEQAAWARAVPVPRLLSVSARPPPGCPSLCWSPPALRCGGRVAWPSTCRDSTCRPVCRGTSAWGCCTSGGRGIHHRVAVCLGLWWCSVRIARANGSASGVRTGCARPVFSTSTARVTWLAMRS